MLFFVCLTSEEKLIQLRSALSAQEFLDDSVSHPFPTSRPSLKLEIHSCFKVDLLWVVFNLTNQQIISWASFDVLVS